MTEKVLPDAEVQRLLQNARASLARQDGSVAVYAAREAGLTITVFPGPQPGTKRVRILKGCSC